MSVLGVLEAVRVAGEAASTVEDFLLHNGIGQNLTAAGIVGALARVFVWPRLRTGLQHLADLHRHHLPHLHPEGPGPLPSSKEKS